MNFLDLDWHFALTELPPVDKDDLVGECYLCITVDTCDGVICDYTIEERWFRYENTRPVWNTFVDDGSEKLVLFWTEFTEITDEDVKNLIKKSLNK